MKCSLYEKLQLDHATAGTSHSNNVSVILVRSFTIFVLMAGAISVSSRTFGQSKNWFTTCKVADNTYSNFDYVGRTIILPGYLQSAPYPAKFILDTGSQRTIIDQALVKQLSLRQVDETDLVAPGGTTKSMLVEINLCLGGHKAGPIIAATQDLRPYTRMYRTNIDAVLGTDFLKEFVVHIDYPLRRVAFLRRSESNKAQVTAIPFQLVAGMPLIDTTLPGDVHAFVIIDTGHFMEIMFYDDISRDLQLHPPFSTRRIGGAADTHIVRLGQIPWIEIGSYRLNRVNVGIHPLVEKNPFNSVYKPGLLGNAVLEKYVIELDYPGLTLRLYAGPQKDSVGRDNDNAAPLR